MGFPDPSAGSDAEEERARRGGDLSGLRAHSPVLCGSTQKGRVSVSTAVGPQMP